jgi:hypothetical protein
MLQTDRDEWERLVAVLDTHPGGPVHDPESPEWEARHVYAHLARWMNNSMDDFEAVLEGRPRPAPPKGDDDEINARWRAVDAGIDLTDARRRAHAAYERRLRLIEGTHDDQWNNLLTAIAAADGHQHYAGHRLYIESAKPQRR